MLEGQAGAASLDLARRSPGIGHRCGHGVPARAVGHSYQGAGRSGVVGEPGPAEHHVGPDLLGHAALERGPGRGPAEVAGAGCRGSLICGIAIEDPVGRLLDGLPARAPAQVSQQGLVDLLRRHRRGGWCGPLGGRPERSEPHHDARSAEPALAAACGHQRGGPAVPLLIG
jgi:hypothetical protein